VAGETPPTREDRQAEFAAAAGAFAAAAERALAGGEASQLAGGDIERAMSAAVKVYAARTEALTGETPAPPVSVERVTPTEVVVVVSEMLRAVDVSLFDLAMWYRRPR
jgi:uncharacterized Ntn-hydrolase superfamily protein